MTEALFEVEQPAATGPVAAERVTEAVMLALLVQRYTRVSMDAHRFAYADHVADRTGFASRIADFIALDCYTAGPWENRRNEWHGHEVKVSRSDWLTELRDPAKSEAFTPYMHRWWLVVPDRTIVKDGELPDGWGLMVKAGGSLRAVVAAPLREPLLMPTTMVATFARAVAKTARRELGVGATQGGPGNA